jgi:hypothetical protein
MVLLRLIARAGLLMLVLLVLLVLAAVLWARMSAPQPRGTLGLLVRTPVDNALHWLSLDFSQRHRITDSLGPDNTTRVLRQVLSPDLRWVAAVSARDIWVKDVAQGTWTQAAADALGDFGAFSAAWSPDSALLIYRVYGRGVYLWHAADGQTQYLDQSREQIDVSIGNDLQFAWLDAHTALIYGRDNFGRVRVYTAQNGTIQRMDSFEARPIFNSVLVMDGILYERAINRLYAHDLRCGVRVLHTHIALNAPPFITAIATDAHGVEWWLGESRTGYVLYQPATAQIIPAPPDAATLEWVGFAWR